MDSSSSSRQGQQQQQHSRLKSPIPGDQWAEGGSGGVEKGTDSVLDKHQDQHHPPAHGLDPALTAVITSWVAHFSGAVALQVAGTESLLAVLRGQQWPVMSGQSCVPEPAYCGARPNHNLMPQNGNAVANNKEPTPAARCELCNVDLTSLEIVEEHENGKRHKKNLQKSQPSEAVETCKDKKLRLLGDSDPNPKPTPRTENVRNGEKIKNSSPAAVSDDEKKKGIQQPGGEAKCSAKCPGKRRMEGFRRGKRQREMHKLPKPKITAILDDHLSRKMQTSKQKPAKAKTITPFKCSLCNVECDAKEVYDHHLSGKKHKSKLKRVSSHGRQLGLQALYPPNSATHNLFHQQHSQQGPNPLGSFLPPANAETALVSGTPATSKNNC